MSGQTVSLEYDKTLLPKREEFPLTAGLRKIFLDSCSF